MLKALNKLFGGRSGVIETAPSVRVLPLKDVEDEEIPRYPPFAKGLPVAPLDKILATQAELIEKVRNSLGFTVDDFNRLVLPVIQRYAAFVHLLPASESHHHRGAGGLFRHGLEVAFWAAQASESVIFSIEGTPRERRDNEPRWRLASCFSGLLHDVGKPLSDVSITDKDGSITWNPYSESLHDWAHRHEIDRYFIRWRDKRHKRHEQFSLLAVDRIIPAETREFLSKSGPSIMEAMLEAISGTSVNQPVTKLMLRADQESVSRDLRQSRLDVDEFSYGVPVERYVFDAIRRLVKTGKWKVNEPGAKVWHLNQGVFIAWKQLGDLYDLISHDKIPGIPRDPDTLADILIERGFAVPNTVQEKGERAYYRYWEVLPEMLQEAAGSVKILMLRLESNDLVFTTEPPAAVAAEVVGDVEDAEIEFVDPEEVDDDQEEDVSALNDDMLAAEQEAEKALAGLGFGDAMEMLKSTSDAVEEKSLSALWLYWAQSLNLVKVLIACVGKMIFVMPVMWFWVLVVCRLVEPERISDVSGLISPDVIGWAAGAAITLIIFSVFTRPALYGYHNFFKQHICSRVKQVTPELRTVTGPLFFYRNEIGTI